MDKKNTQQEQFPQDEQSVQESRLILPKKRSAEKIVFIAVSVLVVIVLFIIFLPSFLNIFAKDIAPIDDFDLLLKKIGVADDQNAYFDLIKLDNIIYEPESKSNVVLDMVDGKTWDETIAEDIVSQNTQAFEYFAEAARKPQFQDPASADPADISPSTVLPSINTWRRMARLSAIRALYLSKQGNDKEAIDEALNSIKIGQKIQESQAPLIEYLVAIAMKGIGLETMQKIVVSSKLSSAELTNYAQGLNAFYKNEDGLINSFKGEYHMQAWTLDALASGSKEALQEIVGEVESENPKIAKKVKNNYYFQPNKTKLLFAEYTRANIKSVHQPCGEIRATEVLMLAPTNPAKLYTEENAIGKIIHDVAAVNLTSASTKKCEEDLLVAATQTILAIRAFKNDNINQPASLGELVPQYLTSIPVDSFNGKALKYSSSKKIIYSVGQDLQDSGGSTGDNWRKMPDPTFKIEF